MSLLPGSAIPLSGYDINNSLRFRASASTRLSRTYAASPTTGTKITISVWVKRGTLSTQQQIINGYNGTSPWRSGLVFRSSDALALEFGGATLLDIVTTPVFRDPSAWYHIVAKIDTTQATAANRCILYVNGSQITSYSTANYPALNANHQFLFGNSLNRIGTLTDSTQFFDGYLAEFNVIDGQALTPSSFGSTNPSTGVWEPIKYTGTYGTNGFYQKYSSIALTSGSNTGLGQDFSGNGNFWNTNNISVTAGVTYDAMIDSPTNTSATVANYAVLNPISKGTDVTISNGNLSYAVTATTNCGAFSTVGMSSGKWYCEFTAQGNDCMFGLGLAISGQILYLGVNAFSWGYYRTGNKYNNGTNSAYGAAFTTNDVIGITFDADIGTLVFYKNNVSQGAAFTGLTSGPYFFAVGNGNIANSIASANFGQRPFTYTPPTGFVRLNTYNLPDSTIKKGNTVMDATLYTGTGTTQTITNAGSFKPDLVWLKTRSIAGNSHYLFDAVRGVGKYVSSDATTAEATLATSLTSFNSNGFSLGTAGGAINGSGTTFVGWQWQAGQGSTSSNTSGSITSTVSVNATAGFSVVTYTGTGANATVGHGLGVAPKMIIVKSRSGVLLWVVYHASLLNTQYIVLNTTAAVVSSSPTVWNSTTPTSSVFSLGTATGVNTNGATFVAYCWAQIAGFSSFGSYIGNGNANGPFIYTGFRPKYVMVKVSSTGARGVFDGWNINDTSRSPFNLCRAFLQANTTAAEDSTNNYLDMDIISNGFKLRSASDGSNTNAQTYIYMAFAENPFKNALAR
jgi:hypothetical protein